MHFCLVSYLFRKIITTNYSYKFETVSLKNTTETRKKLDKNSTIISAESVTLWDNAEMSSGDLPAKLADEISELVEENEIVHSHNAEEGGYFGM